MSTIEEERDDSDPTGEEGEVKDLTFYAKPENYQGTKDSMLRFLSTHRPVLQYKVKADDRSASPLEKGYQKPPGNKLSVTGLWKYNRVTFDRVLPNYKPPAYYIRRITVVAATDERSKGHENAETNDGEGFRKEGRHSIAVSGLMDQGMEQEDGGEWSSPGSDVTARQKARERIRRAISIVLINMRWIALVEKEEKKAVGNEDLIESGKTFTDIASEVAITDDGFTFDLSYFKHNRETVISNEVRQILTTPSAARTPEQIQTAVYGLKHLEAFAEYPQHLQEKLCRVAWFQQVLPKRVIIRRGQPAENFYFVLCGRAVVRFLEQKSTAGGDNQLRTAAILRRGSSFGELALLHRTKRTATVVSQDVIQLLTVGKEDFFRIIIGISPDGGVPDHIRFLSSLDFMEGWPIDILINNPHHCMFLYFKHGAVMVKDSRKSDWIYVVKSGSCQVIKRLVSVSSRTVHQRKSVAEQRKFPPALNASIAFANIVITSSQKSSISEIGSTIPTLHNVPARLSDSGQTIGGSEKRSRRWSYAGITFRKRDVHPVEEKEEARFINASSEPVFIQVEILQPKDVFGLRNISFVTEFEPATGVAASFSLVSNGAECVMLSKKCFIENANASVRSRVLSQIRPYPSDEVLQQNLQTQVDWTAYKGMLMRSCVKSRAVRHSQDHL